MTRGDKRVPVHFCFIALIDATKDAAKKRCTPGT